MIILIKRFGLKELIYRVVRLSFITVLLSRSWSKLLLELMSRKLKLSLKRVILQEGLIFSQVI